MNRTTLCLILFVSVLTLHLPSAKAQTVELQVNGATLDDDYIAWSPVIARARLVDGTASTDVQLSSSQRGGGSLAGEVWFARYSGTRPTSSNFNPSETVTITLPQDGSWVSFWVAGKESSSDGKDVRIIASDATNGQQVGELPLMVRIRKNANSTDFTDLERNRFLSALAELHDLTNQGQNSEYVKYVKVHGDAFFLGIHNSPAFPPWHRSMLLSIERELQEIDPRVALPYWKFDERAPRLFTRDFIGIVTGSSARVQFSASNPIDGWEMPSTGAIGAWQQGDPVPLSTEPMVRDRNAGTSIPGMLDLPLVLRQPQYSRMRSPLESWYHNDAHNHINGWLASLESPRDPLFYLLHANVDRAWALWQKRRRLFGENDSTAYSPQGSYPGPGAAWRQGSYGDDTQWPWNLMGGNQGTSDPGDDWPEFVFDLPAPVVNHGPSTLPVVKESVDFPDTNGSGFPHNFGYDSIKFVD